MARRKQQNEMLAQALESQREQAQQFSRFQIDVSAAAIATCVICFVLVCIKNEFISSR